MFAPGDIVECVDAGPILAHGPHRGKPSGLTLGALYSVAAFYPKGSPHHIPGRTWRYDCADVREAAHPDPKEAFLARRFRLIKRRDPELIGRLLATELVD